MLARSSRMYNDVEIGGLSTTQYTPNDTNCCAQRAMRGL